MLDDNIKNPDKETGLTKSQTLPGVITQNQDNNPNPTPPPAAVGAGIAGKLDEKDGDEFEGGNDTNFYEETLDLGNYDTNKTSKNLIQKTSDKI